MQHMQARAVEYTAPSLAQIYELFKIKTNDSTTHFRPKMHSSVIPAQKPTYSHRLRIDPIALEKQMLPLSV